MCSKKFVFRTEIKLHIGTIGPDELSEGFDRLHDGEDVRSIVDFEKHQNRATFL
jgi:hypothetical protein